MRRIFKLNFIFLFVFSISLLNSAPVVYGKSIETKYSPILQDVRLHISIIKNEKNYFKKMSLLENFIAYANKKFIEKSESLGEAQAQNQKDSQLEVANNAWTYIKLDVELLEDLFIKNHFDVFTCENISYKLGLYVPKKTNEKDWEFFTKDIFEQLSELSANICAARPKSL